LTRSGLETSAVPPNELSTTDEKESMGEAGEEEKNRKKRSQTKTSSRSSGMLTRKRLNGTGSGHKDVGREAPATVRKIQKGNVEKRKKSDSHRAHATEIREKHSRSGNLSPARRHEVKKKGRELKTNFPDNKDQKKPKLEKEKKKKKKRKIKKKRG